MDWITGLLTPSTVYFQMRLSPEQIESFRESVWRHFDAHGRTMPWRDEPTPYRVLVSELMLQQTQVNRVIPKFETFLYTCPDFAALAKVELSDVLELWAGLGYNRRAKYLHQTARVVMNDYGGSLPERLEELVKLPGIGRNTAGAIVAYAYEQPVAFVETNIRTVLFHHFYHDADQKVSDSELLDLVEQTLERERPREWYWALMDYGTYLKKAAGGRLQSSKHYIKQSPLAGSPREMRGRIIRALTDGPCSIEVLKSTVEADNRFDSALEALEREGLVTRTEQTVKLG